MVRTSWRPRSRCWVRAATGVAAQSNTSSWANRFGWLPSTWNTKWASLASRRKIALPRWV